MVDDAYDDKEAQELFQNILDGKVGRFPANFWRQPNVCHIAGVITRYFIEIVLEWTDEDIKSGISEMLFRKNHLSGMLEYVFKRSPFMAINNAYPDKYKPWELTCTPRHYWDAEINRCQAIDFLISTTGKSKYEELSNKEFIQHGLGGLMDYITRHDISDSVSTICGEDEIKSIIGSASFSVTNPKSKRNMITARIQMPVSMLEQIGVTKHNNEIVITVENDCIIIRKLQ